MATIRYWACAGLLAFAAACGDEDSGDGGYSDDEDWSQWTDSCAEPAVGTLPTGTTWQWQLSGPLDGSLDVQMYDLDLFNTSAEEIATLQAAGRTVICYFSAGTWEEWRPDAAVIDPAALGKTMAEWDDERWLDVRHPGSWAMMEARLDLAVQKGCDGVEPDNMDGYVNKTGFDFSGYDQLNFNKGVAVAAHARGLSVGLKNDVDQLLALEPCFDWALNEECHAYDECHKYAPFVGKGKAVFHVEYVDDIADGPELAANVCGDPVLSGFSTLIKDWDLYPWYQSCP